MYLRNDQIGFTFEIGSTLNLFCLEYNLCILKHAMEIKVLFFPEK